jgi:hypothetical protein
MKRLTILIFLLNITSIIYAQNSYVNSSKQDTINKEQKKELLKRDTNETFSLSVGIGIISTSPSDNNSSVIGNYSLSPSLFLFKHVCLELKMEYFTKSKNNKEFYGLGFLPQVSFFIFKKILKINSGIGIEGIIEKDALGLPFIFDSKLEYSISNKFSTYSEIRFFSGGKSAFDFRIFPLLVSLNIKYKF